jgi:uncharacterized protein YciI
MKFFIVDIHYSVPYERIAEIVQDHRAFLQKGFDSGFLLLSGPKEPRSGGFVICKAQSLEKIVEYFDFDPYKLSNASTYTFMEFSPIKYQPWLADWIVGE